MESYQMEPKPNSSILVNQEEEPAMKEVDNNIGVLVEEQDFLQSLPTQYRKQEFEKEGSKNGNPLVQVAKNELKNNNNNYRQVLEDPRFKDFTIDEKFRIRKSAENRRCHAKMKDNSDVKSITSEELQHTMNTRFSEQYNDDPSPVRRIEVLVDLNKEKHIAFFEFLLSLQSIPHSGFLQNISEVIESDAQPKHKLRLFLGICGLYRGGPLTVASDLYDPMLAYLATGSGVNYKQAMGFLRLTYQNNIGLVSAPLETLLKFDRRFGHYWDQVCRCLQGTFWQSELIFDSLPKTCRIMSVPMIKALKSGIVFNFLPAGFFKVIIDMLVFSFSNDQRAFDSIIDALKLAFSSNYEHIQRTQLLNLLELLVKRMVAHDKPWYKNQEGVNLLIKGALQMIDENKVPGVFSSELCTQLLDKHVSIQEFLSRPAQICQTKTNEKSNLEEICNHNKSNQEFLKLMPLLSNDVAIKKGYLESFDIIGVQPTASQELCLSLMQHRSHLFLNPGLGVGKSTLICALSIGLSQEVKESIIVLNSDHNLLNRDYQRVRQRLELSQTEKYSKLTLQYYAPTCSQDICINGHITFMSPLQLCQAKLPSNYSILFDEFHTSFFNDSIFKMLPIINRATSFIGTSGSPLAKPHVSILQEAVPGSLVITFPDPSPYNTEDRTIIVLKSISQQHMAIAKLAKQLREKTPVLIILEEPQHLKYMDQPVKNRGPTVMLCGGECDEFTLNTILTKQFNQKGADGFYGAYLTNRQGGTGTDYQSSPVIEENGGINVIIGLDPSSYSEFCQFKKRTGRMTQKGSIHYVFQNKTYIGHPSLYVSQLEMNLQQREDYAIRGHHRKLKTFLQGGQDIALDTNIPEMEGQEDQKLANAKQIEAKKLDIDIEKESELSRPEQQTINKDKNEEIGSKPQDQLDHQGNLLNIKENFAQNNGQGQQLNPKEFKQTESFNKNEEDKILEQDPLNTLVKTPIQDPVVKLSIEVNQKLKKSSNNEPSKQVVINKAKSSKPKTIGITNNSKDKFINKSKVTDGFKVKQPSKAKGFSSNLDKLSPISMSTQMNTRAARRMGDFYDEILTKRNLKKFTCAMEKQSQLGFTATIEDNESQSQNCSKAVKKASGKHFEIPNFDLQAKNKRRRL